MATSEDYFDEEEGMVRMTFGEHLEELRRRLLLALFGFLPGVLIGLAIGKPVVRMLATPVERELRVFDQRRLAEFKRQYEQKLASNEQIKQDRLPVAVPVDGLRAALVRAWPQLAKALESAGRQAPGPAAPNGRQTSTAGPATSEEAQAAALPAPAVPPLVKLDLYIDHDALVIATWEPLIRRLGLRALSTQETFMAWMKVSLMVGLIVSSPWVVYQLWAFVAEGLYRHERRIVYRAAPFSIGLFLLGVVFCFVIVLPVVVRFFFGFNRWLNIEPDIRLNEWLSFAVMLPLIFGICFELPLVMLVFETIGIFTLESYTSRWRHAVLAIAVVAMVVTPTTDPGTMMLLMCPMVGLYGLGIFMVRWRMVRRGEPLWLQPKAKLLLGVCGTALAYFVILELGHLVAPDWWFHHVWQYGAWPASALVGKRIELQPGAMPSITWTTAANAAMLGLLLYRAGELVMRLVGGRSRQ